ncbi:MAG: hypothetical protein RIR18_416 [Pseudomonadota bacterium]|jgi:hypothetical protein
MSELKPIPEGYLEDQQGRLVPIGTVKPIDIERDKLVREIVEKAKVVSGNIGQFKVDVFGDIAAFVQLSAEQYGASIGGKKGNVTLLSFDGKFKVQRAIAEHVTFDERLQAAKGLIDECINDWMQGSSQNIQVLVNNAFQVDKEGNINVGRVLSLRRLEIEDDRWNRAMKAIGDAVQVVGSKSYVRVYERIGDSDQYAPIPLDVAAV